MRVDTRYEVVIYHHNDLVEATTHDDFIAAITHAARVKGYFDVGDSLVIERVSDQRTVVTHRYDYE
jgi:hypothetical protein